jgi:thiamine pyrophosphokinase
MKSAVIFSGGYFEPECVTPEYERLIYSSKTELICADGGYLNMCLIDTVESITDNFKRRVTVIGDFDSVYIDEFDTASFNIIDYPVNKDETDTLLAVQYAVKHNCDNIVIFGALGRRFDHSMANIQTLIWAYRNGAYAKIITETDSISVQGKGIKKYRPLYGDSNRISVMSLTETSTVTISGVRYPTEDYVLTNSFPIGVSNLIYEEACVDVKDGLVLCVTDCACHVLPVDDKEVNKAF